jgi:hypothetical protein
MLCIFITKPIIYVFLTQIYDAFAQRYAIWMLILIT